MGVIHWKFCPSLHYMGVIHWGLLKLPTYAALVEDPEFRKYIDLYAKVLVAEFSYRQGFVANLGIGDYLRRSWKGKTKGGEKRRKRKLERQLNLVKENCSVVETGGMEEIASSFRVQDCYVL
ncbi:uncharacterized protein LOC126634336 [Malus sylvestris]|uniref:uncharacterized protein LOC126634336 n=1 Tax=Malus sylvestris TaxID=3752 RepID=UPI0010AAA98B|nr:uncharacterized protein LOC103409600 [Malus domestica]XP_050160812.1 uncharacterized protein LOC126634336 [Malus sylvestris]